MMFVPSALHGVLCGVLVAAAIARATRIPNLQSRDEAPLSPPGYPPSCTKDCRPWEQAMDPCAPEYGPQLECACTEAANFGLVECWNCVLAAEPQDLPYVGRVQASVAQQEDDCAAAGMPVISLTVNAAFTVTMQGPTSPAPHSVTPTSSSTHSSHASSSASSSTPFHTPHYPSTSAGTTRAVPSSSHSSTGFESSSSPQGTPTPSTSRTSGLAQPAGSSQSQTVPPSRPPVPSVPPAPTSVNTTAPAIISDSSSVSSSPTAPGASSGAFKLSSATGVQTFVLVAIELATMLFL